MAYINTSGKRVIFFGDSITQAAVEPGGYIRLLEQKLAANAKAEKYQLIGAGIGGNKVTDLQQRIDRDVLSKNPDLVVIYIGINDVWQFAGECCERNESRSAADNFEAGLQEIVEKVKEEGADVVLCTPTVIGERRNNENEQDEMLDEYAAIVRSVAEKSSSPVCDLRNIFKQYLKENNADNLKEGILTYDQVHLNEQGNSLVADSMFKYL